MSFGFQSLAQFSWTANFSSSNSSCFISWVDGSSHPSFPHPHYHNFNLYSIDFDTKYVYPPNPNGHGMRFLARYQFPLPCFFLVPINSCNGLLSIFKLKDCCILNPMTCQILKLPLPASISDRLYHYEYGLGFSLNSNTYKVIKIGFPQGDYIDTTMEICTLGHDTKWRSIDFSPHNYEDASTGVYINGALHWIAQDTYENVYISRIDVENESFEAVSLPTIDSIESYALGIGVFNGHLYASFLDTQKPFHVWEIWKMMEGDLWIKDFVVEYDHQQLSIDSLMYLQLLKVCKDGEILILIYPRRELISYNPKNGKFKTLHKYNDKDLRLFWVEEIVHPNFNSLHKILTG